MTMPRTNRFHHRLAGYEIWGDRLLSGRDVGDIVWCEPIPTSYERPSRIPSRWVFAVGDFTGTEEAALRYSAAVEEALTSSAGYDLASDLERLNRGLCKATHEVGFACLVLGRLEGEGHEVILGNAGHLPPFLRRVEAEVANVAEDIAGMPLGVDPGQTYQTTSLTLRPGEVLVFHSHGLTAIWDSEGGILTLDQLRNAIADAAPDAASVGLGVLRAAEESRGARPYRDDLTLICIGRVIVPTVGPACTASVPRIQPHDRTNHRHRRHPTPD
jgi:serine phosphatase RsbU (regulator of sigma subunit)